MYVRTLYLRCLLFQAVLLSRYNIYATYRNVEQFSLNHVTTAVHLDLDDGHG